MIDDHPTYLDLVMSLGPEEAENYVLERTYHGTDLKEESW